jgi:hypothetical protein
MHDAFTNSTISLSVPYRDSQWLDILSSTGQAMRVGCIYRSPTNNEDQLNTLLEHIKDVVKSTPPATEIVLCGDYKMNNWLAEPNLQWTWQPSCN